MVYKERMLWHEMITDPDDLPVRRTCFISLEPRTERGAHHFSPENIIRASIFTLSSGIAALVHYMVKP